MTRETKQERLQKIHAMALEEFDADWSAVWKERELCIEDRRFATIAGAQWEGALGEQFENKPKFEVNKVHGSIIRIINDYRSNRITTDFVPKDGKKADKLADTLDGLYRADEIDSVADEAKDNAFEEAVTGGFGAYRLRACYEDENDEENEHQRIRFDPIYDADSCVFFDNNARRQDKSDAKRCFVLVAKSRAAYKAEYGEDPATWPKPSAKNAFDWVTTDLVYIAEYYRVDDASVTIQTWRNVLGEEERYTAEQFREDPDLEAHLIAVGSTLEKTRKIHVNKVRKLILNGNRVLEDCGYIAGDQIPIIPVYGKRWMVDGIERCMGHVRLAKDAQRLANMQRSKLGEISAMSVVSKPIFHPEQVAGLSNWWAEDNTKNYPYLLINPMTDASGAPVPAGPIGYTKSPEVPPAMAALLQTSEADLADILGNTQAPDDVTANTSGVAMELVHKRIDGQAAIFMTNFAKAEKRSGEVWFSMSKEVYFEEGREMKTVGRDGSTSTVMLSRPISTENGIEVENDIANAKFSISVQVGPSSSSSKNATVRSITTMMQMTEDPQTKAILGSMAMMNMEGEGIEDVRAFFRKDLVRKGVVRPTDEEAQEMAQEMAQRGKTPQDLYLEAAAQEASANAQRAQADTIVKGTQAQQNKVKTAQIAQEIQQGMTEQALEILEKFTPDLPKAPEVSVVRLATPQAPNPFGSGPATV